MLIRFLQACHESRQLYKQFFFSIYKPLHQLFGDEKAQPLARKLERVLEQWSSLLAPGPINHRQLSEESSKAVHNMNLTNKPRDTQFNLVLRLVPDFAVKGYEALLLARQWRNILGDSGYSRELTFIHSKKKWPSRNEEPNDSVFSCSTFHDLERKLKQTQNREVMDSTAQEKKEHLIGIFTSHDYEIDPNIKIGSLKANARASQIDDSSALFIPGSGEQRINFLRAALKREQIKVQRIRTEILQGQITSRYTSERAMVKPLLNTLAVAKTNCWRLRNEISKEEQGGNFILHRCYSERLDSQRSVQAGFASIASERIRLVTRPLLNSRHNVQTRDQRLGYDALLTRGSSRRELPKLFY